MSSAFAVVGLFSSPDGLLKAIHHMKAHKMGRLETYTPYPVHGIDEALELRRSPLGGMVLVMAILGAVTALGFQYWITHRRTVRPRSFSATGWRRGPGSPR